LESQGALQVAELQTSHPDTQRNAQELLETVWGQSGAFNDNCELYVKMFLSFGAFGFDSVEISVLCVCSSCYVACSLSGNIYKNEKLKIYKTCGILIRFAWV
jgi:hypothetical protein